MYRTSGLGAAETHDEVIQLAGMLKGPVAYSYKAKMVKLQAENKLL
jgi:pyruvate dehydrogenase (quinone)